MPLVDGWSSRTRCLPAAVPDTAPNEDTVLAYVLPLRPLLAPTCVQALLTMLLQVLPLPLGAAGAGVPLSVPACVPPSLPVVSPPWLKGMYDACAPLPAACWLVGRAEPGVASAGHFVAMARYSACSSGKYLAGEDSACACACAEACPGHAAGCAAGACCHA